MFAGQAVSLDCLGVYGSPQSRYGALENLSAHYIFFAMFWMTAGFV